MIRESPILFITPMVQAILEGRKTMTRRTRGLKVINERPNDWTLINDFKSDFGDTITFQFSTREKTLLIKCPYGKRGDLLWVRETIYQEGELGLYYVADKLDIDESTIPEDYKPYRNYACCKVPAIHMQKSIARIWLEVTDVRVERLHRISEADAEAEGAQRGIFRDGPNSEKGEFHLETSCNGSAIGNHSDGFKYIWYQINGEKSWYQNPWLWVVSFKVLSTTGKLSTLNPELTEATK